MKFGMTKNGFRQLCVKIISGSGSDEEKIKLNEYLKKSSDYKNEFDELNRIWNRQSSFADIEIPEIDMEWSLLNERINTIVRSEIVEKSSINMFDRIKSLFVFRTRYAFQLALVLAVLITGYFLFFSPETQVKILFYTTSRGEQKVVQFPDGSTACLNSASKIEVPEFFSDSLRLVKLSGEAFFSINKDSRPFLVKTKNATTRVLGTKFNIWARGNETRVIVREGIVNLASSDMKNNGVNIIQNQLSSVLHRNPPAQPENVDSEYMLGWLEGRLVFNKTSMKEIVEELSRFYNVSINIKNDSLQKYSLTGSFKNSDIDSVLNIICLTLDLDYEKNVDGYLLK